MEPEKPETETEKPEKVVKVVVGKPKVVVQKMAKEARMARPGTKELTISFLLQPLLRIVRKGLTTTAVKSVGLACQPERVAVC